MKNSIFYSILLSIILLSCKEDLPPDLVIKGDLVADPNLYIFNRPLLGTNFSPAVSTTATGNISGSYHKKDKILNLNIVYSGLTPNAWNIRKGAEGLSGGIVFNMGSTFTSPFIFSTPALSTSFESDLLGGLNYVNIASAKNMQGELRAQIKPETSKATGAVTGSFNKTSKILTLTINYSNTTPTAWNIKKINDNERGLVVFDLGSTFKDGFVYTSAPFTAAQEADLEAGKYYLCINSQQFPDGEIKGQLKTN
jgi:hypothetical protein